jgi:hypothetical protein
MLRHTIWSWGLGVAGALLAYGCADLLDLPDAPAVIAKDPWRCEATAGAAAPPPRMERARVQVHACDFISTNCSQAVRGLTAKLCDKRDIHCATPIQTGIQDVDGDLSFEVATGGPLGSGFDGYLVVTPPAVLCTDTSVLGGASLCVVAPQCDPSAPDMRCLVPTYGPALLFFNPPIMADVPQPIVLPLVPTLAGASLLMAAGERAVTVEVGSVFARGLDCRAKPAPGLSFVAVPQMMSVLYQNNGVFSTNAKTTDASGIAGLIGVPSGIVNVSAYDGDPANGRKVADFGAQVWSGFVTYVTLLPSSG